MATIGILQAIILGIVQGLTEWLPVSSSGHLAFVQLALDLQVPVFYDAVLHLGTLVGVFAIYRNDIVAILTFQRESKGSFPHGRRMLLFIVLGTIPTAAIGFAFRSLFESSFYDPFAIGVGFFITGGLLLATKLKKPGSKKMGSIDAVLIGVGQGISIFSSISRSGATVAAGMFRGVEREQLVRYSFLLSIPAILGAVALDLITMEQEQAYSVGLESYVAGAAVASIVGYLSIRLLIKAVVGGKFYLFAIYCFLIGVVALLLL